MKRSREAGKSKVRGGGGGKVGSKGNSAAIHEYEGAINPAASGDRGIGFSEGEVVGVERIWNTHAGVRKSSAAAGGEGGHG